jgi:hypothetical protein
MSAFGKLACSSRQPQTIPDFKAWGYREHLADELTARLAKRHRVRA